MIALDAVVEIFAWLGFAGAALFGLVGLVLWVADGSWLPADALVDHDDDGAVVRWYDADGDVNSARVQGEEFTDGRTVCIWYRYGWRDRMRLTRRPPGLVAVAWAAAGLLALGVVSLVVSWVLLFARG